MKKKAQNGEFHMFFSGLNMRRKHDPDLWLTFMKPLQKICYGSDDYIFLGRCGWVILLKSHEPAEHGSSGAVGVQHPRLTKPGPLLGPQRILSCDQKNTSEESKGKRSAGKSIPPRLQGNSSWITLQCPKCARCRVQVPLFVARCKVV